MSQRIFYFCIHENGIPWNPINQLAKGKLTHQALRNLHAYVTGGGGIWQAVSSYVRFVHHNFPLRNTNTFS